MAGWASTNSRAASGLEPAGKYHAFIAVLHRDAQDSSVRTSILDSVFAATPTSSASLNLTFIVCDAASSQAYEEPANDDL
jgi:hypothetical protein